MPKQRSAYTTDGIPDEASVDTWKGYLAEVYYGHEVKPIDSDFVVGSLEKRLLGEVGFSRHRASPHTISRTPELIKADKIEQHAFVFPNLREFLLPAAR